MELWINSNVSSTHSPNVQRVASIPVEVESYKHVNQDLYAKFSIKWMDTGLIVDHDDELTHWDHHQHYAAQFSYILLKRIQMSIKIERICDDKCQLGESPFWDQKSQSLYYVDIFGKTVHRYTPSTNTHIKAIVGEKNVSFIIPIQGLENTFLIGFGNEIAKLKWDGVTDKIDSLETVIELKNSEERRHRWNDGKIDPLGRLWAGVFIQKEGMAQIPNAGALYALKSDKTLEKLVSGISLSNGLTWNEKINKFYYIDTNADEIYEFNYNDLKLSNRQVIFKLKDHGITAGPDGMTMDSDGNLWIACFGGAKIVVIDPKKPNAIHRTIDMPVPQVTCVEFAGQDYEDLYVTTAGIAKNDAKAPEGGWTYKITGLGIRGLPAREAKF